MAYEHEKRLARERAEARRRVVLREMIELLQKRGHPKVQVDDTFGWIKVVASTTYTVDGKSYEVENDYSVGSVSIDNADRSKEGVYVCRLRFKISYYHRRGAHYPEPKDGWPDMRLREFADMIHAEVEDRVRSDQQDEDRRQLKESRSAQAERINSDLGTDPGAVGVVYVAPNRELAIKMPAALTEEEARLVARFVIWLKRRRTDSDAGAFLIFDRGVGEARDPVTVTAKGPVPESVQQAARGIVEGLLAQDETEDPDA